MKKILLVLGVLLLASNNLTTKAANPSGLRVLETAKYESGGRGGIVTILCDPARKNIIYILGTDSTNYSLPAGIGVVHQPDICQ